MMFISLSGQVITGICVIIPEETYFWKRSSAGKVYVCQKQASEAHVPLFLPPPAATILGATLSLTLEVSGAFDDSLSPSVATDIFSFLVASVAARWFRITWPGRSGEYLTESENILSEIIRKLYHRRRPVRR